MSSYEHQELFPSGSIFELISLMPRKLEDLKRDLKVSESQEQDFFEKIQEMVDHDLLKFDEGRLAMTPNGKLGSKFGGCGRQAPGKISGL